jgi:hypothetical protein
VEHGPVGVAAERVPARRRLDRRDRPHVDADLERVGAIGGEELDTTFAGVGEDPLRIEIAASCGERLGEAAMPLPLISARLPSALNSVIRAA